MSTNISQKNLHITRSEAESFFRSIKPHEIKYRILLFLVNNGCRPIEAVKLHLSDFVKKDFSQFYVDNTKVVRKGKPPRRDLKIIPSWIAKELKTYVDKAYLYNEIKGGYIFPTNAPGKFTHMQTNSFRAWFSERRKLLGLDEIVGWNLSGPILAARGIFKVPQYRVQIYSFRRLLATEEAARGVALHFISARMGHLDTRITSGYVQRERIMAMLPDIVEKMPRFLDREQEKLATYF